MSPDHARLELKRENYLRAQIRARDAESAPANPPLVRWHARLEQEFDHAGAQKRVQAMIGYKKRDHPEMSDQEAEVAAVRALLIAIDIDPDKL